MTLKRLHRPLNTITPRLNQAQSTVHTSSNRSSTAQGYGYRWQKSRAGYLAKYPLCVECEKEGRVEEATELDHIIPHKGDMLLFWDFEKNVQGLCKSHHSKKTSAEDGGFGNKIV